MANRTSTTSDPLAFFTVPPPGESPGEKRLREAREAEEKNVSDRIDEEIRLEERARRREVKSRSVVKVLLLGQSESGKSTTLKNLRMKYAREDWKKERMSWRSVIQLNLLRNVLSIVDVVQAQLQTEGQAEQGPNSPLLSANTVDSAFTDDAEEAGDDSPLSANLELRTLLRRLGPLRRVEADLKRKLGAGTEEVTPVKALEGEQATHVLGNSSPQAEIKVRCWQDALILAAPRSDAGSPVDGDDEATDVIASCKDDIHGLWTNPEVRGLLAKKHLRPEETAGFFLYDLDRIATRRYEPSDDDVVRARLRTVGVQEWKLRFERADGYTGSEMGKEWRVFDVGGARTSRHAWLPYFEMVDAIIFLAPISCFDERLAEDPSVNRLEDTLKLFRAVVQSPLLAKSTMVLFLNKCDLLKRKLKVGKVRFSAFLTSYTGPEDVHSVVRYLRDKFKDISKELSPMPRTIYIYPTSVTDTKATAVTLNAVRDGILREHLKHADFV